VKASPRRGERRPWGGGSPGGYRGPWRRKKSPRANGLPGGSKALKEARSFGFGNRQEGNGRREAVRLPGEGKTLEGGNLTGACGMKQGHKAQQGVSRRRVEKAQGRNLAGYARPRVSGPAALAPKGPGDLGRGVEAETLSAACPRGTLQRRRSRRADEPGLETFRGTVTDRRPQGR